MIDQDLMRKLESEQPLTAEETLRLDAMLDDDPGVSNAVACLPEDEPSLEWRSRLNQELKKHARPHRPAPQARFRWLLGGGAAAVAASAAIVAVFVHGMAKPSVPSEASPNAAAVAERGEPTIEEMMIQAHRDSVRPVSLGVHLPAESGSTGYDWSHLESL